MFILQATKNCLICQERELLTSGSVNVNQVQFNFNADWDGLNRTAVFQVGDTAIEVVLTQTNTCYIPWEVLKSARRMCYAGVYGTDADGNVVLPTIWASLGEIRCGTTHGENQQPPTPDMYDQLKAIADQAEQIAQSVRDDADAGKFDGAPGPQGEPGVQGPPGEGIPAITAADAGKYLSAGADQTAKWDSPVVFIDSEAAGIKWPDLEGTVVSAETIAALQDAFDNHKPLMMSAAFGGISGTLTMTASESTGSSSIFTGIISFPEEVFKFDLYGAMLQLNADSSKVSTIIIPINVKGDQGDEGPEGPQGPPGPATTITIGATTTTEPGTDASVKSTPTDDGIQLAFSIPRGQEGQTGPEGKQGIQGEPGPATVVSVAETVTGQPGTDASVAATATEDGIALHFTIPRGTPGGAEIDDAAINPGQAWSSRKIVDTLAPAFEASGAAVSCWPIAGYPLHVVSQVTASQPGTGDPSFENARPISGWTSATARLCGKNLLDLSSAKIGYPYEYAKNFVTTISGDTVTWGGEYGNTSGGMIVFPCPVNVPVTIKFSSSAAPLGGAVFGCDGVDENDLIINQDTTYNFTPGLETTVMYTSAKPYIAFAVNNADPSSITSTDFIAYVGTGDQAYVPFDPASKAVTLSFGQTVYGGTLDWQSGVLTIAYAMSDMSAFTWSKYSDRTNVYGFYCVPPNSANFSYNLAKSDKLRYISGAASGVEGFGNGDVSNRLFVYINKTRLLDNTVDSFEAFLAENPVTFVYLLASPTTVQLTPQEMLALSGENTIYTDTGDTTVSGRADPNAVIQQLTARIAALEGKSISG